MLRPAIEAIPASEYLEASYYERWLRAVEAGSAEGATGLPILVSTPAMRAARSSIAAALSCGARGVEAG